MKSETKWYVKYTYVPAGLMLTVYAMIQPKSVLLPFLFALFFFEPFIFVLPLAGDA